jgi:hypothetical protein
MLARRCSFAWENDVKAAAVSARNICSAAARRVLARSLPEAAKTIPTMLLTAQNFLRQVAILPNAELDA